MGLVLILLGIGLWYFWASDEQKGKQDPSHWRPIHSSPAGCLPYIVAFALIGFGISVLVS